MVCHGVQLRYDTALTTVSLGSCRDDLLSEAQLTQGSVACGDPTTAICPSRDLVRPNIDAAAALSYVASLVACRLANSALLAASMGAACCKAPPPEDDSREKHHELTSYSPGSRANAAAPYKPGTQSARHPSDAAAK